MASCEASLASDRVDQDPIPRLKVRLKNKISMRTLNLKPTCLVIRYIIFRISENIGEFEVNLFGDWVREWERGQYISKSEMSIYLLLNIYKKGMFVFC